MIKYFIKNKEGQVMFLTVVVLGAIISSVTVIAGVLMSFQLRRSADVAASARAIFASDAGVECMLYEIFGTNGDLDTAGKVSNCEDQSKDFSNKASYDIRGVESDIVEGVPRAYKSIGRVSNSVRSIDIRLDQ